MSRRPSRASWKTYSAEEFPSEYTTESTASGEARRPQAHHHGQLVRHRPPQGGRSPACASCPGTGKWTINGRTLDNYFPNKVHQQIVNEPFVVLGAEDQFDVIARINGGGVTGQAGALRMGISRALTAPGRRGQPPAAEEGRLPDP